MNEALREPKEKGLWQSRYEQLRQAALAEENDFGLKDWGLAVLIRQGLVGWMEAWRDPNFSDQQAPPSSAPIITDETGAMQCSVKRLLINMALSHAD